MDVVNGLTGFATSMIPGGDGMTLNLLGPMLGLGILMILVGFGIYVYIALAYSKIGEKASIGSPGIAWMPYGGPLAVIFEAAKAKWWPFLALAGSTVLAYILLLLGISGSGAFLFVAPAIMIVGFILFGVMTIIWHWKTYEVVGKPGWWILVPIIGSVLGFLILLAGSGIGIIIYLLSIIAHLVLIGVAAWKD